MRHNGNSPLVVLQIVGFRLKIIYFTLRSSFSFFLPVNFQTFTFDFHFKYINKLTSSIFKMNGNINELQSSKIVKMAIKFYFVWMLAVHERQGIGIGKRVVTKREWVLIYVFREISTILPKRNILVPNEPRARENRVNSRYHSLSCHTLSS